MEVGLCIKPPKTVKMNYLSTLKRFALTPREDLLYQLLALITQAILFSLNQLYQKGLLQGIKVYTG